MAVLNGVEAPIKKVLEGKHVDERYKNIISLTDTVDIHLGKHIAVDMNASILTKSLRLLQSMKELPKTELFLATSA